MSKNIVKFIKGILMFFGILFIIECIYFVFILNDKKDYCLDNNICEEGLEINTEHGLLKINKENCEKYGYKWYTEKKMCDFNINEKNKKQEH